MLPKDLVKPAVNYTHPSERAYLDESTSTLANGKVFDETKSGKDYGIKDPGVTEPLTGTKSETGNGAGTVTP